MPSDQERAEENLERLWLVLTWKNCWFEPQTAGEAIGAEKGKRRQENDWNGNGLRGLNAWRCGKT